MKKLYIGIVFTVIGSLIFLGWVIDQLAVDNEPNSLPVDLVVYQKIMHGIADSLNNVEQIELNQQLERLNKQFQVTAILEEVGDLALPISLDNQLHTNYFITLQSDDATHLYYLLSAHTGVLLRMTILQEIEGAYVTDIALTLALYIGISLSLVIWLVPLTKRLSLLDKVAASFGQGYLEQRISASRFSYIEGIENSFNRMATQIETLVADNKLLAGSLSHDLRTPVSCLRFGIEAAIDCEDPAQKAHYLNRVEEELTRLEDMLEAFLEYASMERYGLALNPIQHDLSQLVISAVHELTPLAEQQTLSVCFDKPEFSSLLFFDGHWLHRAFVNLLSNAMDYADKQIVVQLVDNDTEFLLRVHDDGAGVNQSKRVSIFDAFVQVDKSRTRQNTHFGLGLAIVKRVAFWHGGQASVDESELLGGACFCLTLPKDSPLISKRISPK